ncbi:MAG: hypothetical protein K9M57_06615 [Phycisphaerae bacterium]|nr:hypothetical protein [Phycisphaerae bacterium]
MRSKNKFESKLKQLHIETSGQGDREILTDLLKTLKSTQKISASRSGAGIRRFLMQSKLSKYAAAAIIVIAVGLGINMFSGQDTSSMAFAEMLEKIRTSSYTFDLTLHTDDNASTTNKTSVYQPGRVRFDAKVGVGFVSSITDTRQGKTLILFNQHKTATIIENADLPGSDAAGGIFSLCMKPIENLWNLRDGSQKNLGAKEIDGVAVEGFKVVSDDKYFNYNIVVWAQIKTLSPVQVTIKATPHDLDEKPMKWTMENFDLDAQLDESQFSMKPPKGYTLSDQVGLDEVEQKPVQSKGADQIREVLNLWSQGNELQAVDLLKKINWKAPMKFTGQPYFFSMSEKQWVALKQKDREKVHKEVMATQTALRRIAKKAVSLGQAAMAGKDYDKAEKYLNSALELGKLINRDPDAVMLIVHLVGIGVEKYSLKELTTLYSTTNQQQKLQTAQDEFERMEAFQADYKKKIGIRPR